jgi:RNA polymerase sigma-70 factor, ECF subfamily
LNNAEASGEHTRPMEAADISDIRKIERVQGGEPEAYEPLVKKYMSRAQGVAMQFVQNAEDSCELVQDAFLKSFRAIARFDTTQRFFPWFYQILKNTCLSHLRRKKLARTYSMSGKDEDTEDMQVEDESTVHPADDMVRGDVRREFWRAYELLPPRDREILALYHFEQLEYQQIATKLGIPIGTVMSRLFHARRRLRERLEPHLET